MLFYPSVGDPEIPNQGVSVKHNSRAIEVLDNQAGFSNL